MKNIKNRQGNSIIELIVGMGLFATVMTITVGFFIVIVKLENDYKRVVNLHQEGRTISEIFNRTIREAKDVTVVYSVDGGITTKRKSPSVSDGNINACYSGIINNSIYMTTADGSNIVKFYCAGSMGLYMATIPNKPTPATDAQIDAAEGASLNSQTTNGIVWTSSFTVFRPVPETYPKALGYSIQLKDRSPSLKDTKGGDMYLRGFINMRNEQ